VGYGRGCGCISPVWKTGHPPQAPETAELIERLATENPARGYVRIQGEPQKLGIRVLGAPQQWRLVSQHQDFGVQGCA
jgi:hypothetical protein